MKNQTGIWIDGSKAIIISLNNGKEVISEIEAEIENAVHHFHQGKSGTFMGEHHINDERKFDERKKHQIDAFVDKVIGQIKNSDELFIMGPAQLKFALKNKIESDHILAPKLKAVEACDHMTLNQYVEKVKSFFKK